MAGSLHHSHTSLLLLHFLCLTESAGGLFELGGVCFDTAPDSGQQGVNCILFDVAPGAVAIFSLNFAPTTVVQLDVVGTVLPDTDANANTPDVSQDNDVIANCINTVSPGTPVCFPVTTNQHSQSCTLQKGSKTVYPGHAFICLSAGIACNVLVAADAPLSAAFAVRRPVKQPCHILNLASYPHGIGSLRGSHGQQILKVLCYYVSCLQLDCPPYQAVVGTTCQPATCNPCPDANPTGAQSARCFLWRAFQAC
jgi:hypothetical protein